MADTIFTRYGGFASVSRVVSDFYGHVRESKILMPFFEGVDMARLIDHQTKFIASMMGGPASFSDEHLARIHARMGIDDGAFEEMAMILREALEDHDFDETDIATVMGEVISRKPLVVTVH